MSQAPKCRWQRVDGVLLLDKAGGMTSNDALQKARRLFSAEKGGHTGTLDPMATGLLPLCFGEATKFSADLLNADKIYEAEICLGVITRTGDAEGDVIKTRPVSTEIDEVAFVAVLSRFLGEQRQVPPMYSALKKDGKPLYELARKGIEVEREARTVFIHSLKLLSFTASHARVRVHCSKGTYIRTLAEDIGHALDCGAHLSALRRTGVGDLCLPAALTLTEIEACPEERRTGLLQPVDALLQNFPVVVLADEVRERFTNGNPVPGSADGRTGPCRVYHGGMLLGLGHIDSDGKLHPQRLIARRD